MAEYLAHRKIESANKNTSSISHTTYRVKKMQEIPARDYQNPLVVVIDTKILFEMKYNLLFRDGELCQLSIGHECAQHVPKVRNRKIWLAVESYQNTFLSR